MKRSLFVTILNILLVLAFLLWIPNMSYIKATLVASFLIAFPWAVYLCVNLFKSSKRFKILFCLNIAVSLFFVFIIYTSYKSHLSEIDMHFDVTKQSSLQKAAEQNIQDFILENAKYPKSYVPLQFGNIDSTKVYKLQGSVTDSSVLRLLESSKELSFDSIREKEFRYGNYFLQHSYYLKSVSGRKLSRVAYIELNRNLQVVEIFNQADFGEVTWENAFGKKEPN